MTTVIFDNWQWFVNRDILKQDKKGEGFGLSYESKQKGPFFASIKINKALNRKNK